MVLKFGGVARVSNLRFTGGFNVWGRRSGLEVLAFSFFCLRVGGWGDGGGLRGISISLFPAFVPAALLASGLFQGGLGASLTLYAFFF